MSVWQVAVRSFVLLQRTDPKADQFPRLEGRWQRCHMSRLML